MNDSKIYFNKILSNYKKQHFRAGLLRDILIWIVLNSAFVIICLLLERIWFLSPAVKKILWALFSLNLLFPLRIFISAVTWFTGNANRDRRILLDLGSAFLDIQDKLYNHYQLSLKKNEFARFAVRRFMNTYPAQFFIKKAPRPFSPSLLRYTISLSLCAGLLIALFLPAGKRLIRPQTEFLPNLPYSISFMQNDTTIFAGDSLNFLVFKSAAPNFPLQLIQTRKGSQSPISFNIISDSLLSVGFGKIRSDLQITAAIRRPNIFYPRRFLATDTLRIQVLHRPRLESLEFKLVFPAYTRRYPEYYPGNIDRIKILPGTRVSISAELSAAAGPSHILYRESKIPFTILDRSLSCDILPDSSGRMIFHLQNSNSVRTENLPEYRIRVVPDRLPELSVLQPEKKELGLRSEKSLRILAEIRDDYGFAHAAIFYRKNSPYNREDSTFQHFDLPLQPELTLQQIDTLWEFPLISPGTELEFYIGIWDNDTINGPKQVTSDRYYARFPSLTNMFSNMNKEQSKQQQSLNNLERSAARQSEILGELQDRIRRQGKLSWDDKSALSDAVKNFESMQDPLEQLKTNIEKQLKTMKKNQLFSEQTMEKYGKLQSLMNEIFDREMLDLMEQIRKSLDKEKTNDLDKLVDKMVQKEKEFRQNLDRLTSVFKRIRQEQRLEAISALMKENLKKQAELLEQDSARTNSDLAVKEKKLSQDAENWEKLANDSESLFEQDFKNDYHDFLQEMRKAGISEKMSQSASNYSQQQRQSGSQSAQSAKKELEKLNQSFSGMSQSMMQQQRDEIVSDLAFILQKTLSASEKQETLRKLAEDSAEGSLLFAEILIRQDQVFDMTADIHRDLTKLAKKTFLVNKAVGQATGQALSGIQSAIRNMEQAHWSAGKNAMVTAHASLNRLARILLDRMNAAQSQQGGASGMESYMEQLQQMAGAQSNINQGMPQPGMSGRPGQGMMDKMADMAARQQALRRALKDLQKQIEENGGSGSLPGNLDHIADEMEKVINDLRRKKLSRRTIQRQQSIEQRLLDASRSAKSKESKSKRTSKTAENYKKISPEGLPSDLGERRSLIRRLLEDVRSSKLSPREKQEMEKYLQLLQQTIQDGETK